MHNEVNKLLCNSLAQAAQDVFTSGFLFAQEARWLIWKG